MARDRDESRRPSADDRQGIRVSPKAVVSLVALVVLLIFAFQNTDRVRVDLIATSRDVRLIYVIIGSAVLGAIIDRFLSWRSRRAEDR